MPSGAFLFAIWRLSTWQTARNQSWSLLPLGLITTHLHMRQCQITCTWVGIKLFKPQINWYSLYFAINWHMSQFLHVLLKVGSFKITTLLFQSKQVQNRFNLVQDYVFLWKLSHKSLISPLISTKFCTLVKLDQCIPNVAVSMFRNYFLWSKTG